MHWGAQPIQPTHKGGSDRIAETPSSEAGESTAGPASKQVGKPEQATQCFSEPKQNKKSLLNHNSQNNEPEQVNRVVNLS